MDMTANEPPDDVPEADRAEQLREAVPDDTADPELDDDLEIDPLKADEADQLEQAIVVPDDDEDDRPE
ncbi:MAG: hypothetical protein J2P23_13975 [Microlunatus sp.]|nr:hypothetical protein [Microlunatus sp.]